ncbi:MAG: hypothetical protein U9R42_14575 [Bacteroidota bacterium]|nr:hypothetical protein [Bacteroidota bacterium]
MEFDLKNITLIVLALIFVLKRVFAKHPIVVKYNSIITSIIIFALALIMVFMFWNENLYIGIFAVALGSIAIIKVVYDFSKKTKNK